MTSSDPAASRTWDYSLTVVTVLLLGGIGLQSFLGTLYVWWAENSVPNWDQTLGYSAFVDVMNAIAAPQIVLLVVAMGLCVPKRLFSRTVLLWVSVGMVLAGMGIWAFSGSLATGLAAYLAFAGLIQVAVVAMTVAGVRGPSYLTRGRLTKTGSGLLHLGFIVFAFVVVALQNSTFMLPFFWAASLFTLAGTALSFYADRLAVRRVKQVEVETGF